MHKLLIFFFLLSTYCQNIEEMTNPGYIYNIVVFGITGVGKSSILNMLAGKEEAFNEGSNSNSKTTVTIHQTHTYNGHSEGIKLRLVDTPGLDNGDNLMNIDMQNIENMVESLKQLKYVNLYLICLDGKNPRSSYLSSMITKLKKAFPKFLDHSVLVFTKWDSTLASRQTDLTNEYQVIFSKDYQVKNINCFFIDSFYNLKKMRMNDDGTVSQRYLHQNIRNEVAKQSDALISYLVEKKSEDDVGFIVKPFKC